MKLILKLSLKIVPKMMSKWCVINWWKLLLKIDRKWPIINCLKIDQKVLKNWFAMGGSKSSKIDLGDPDPPKRNFLKFCSFLQKLPHFSTPKSTPINGPINFPFPTKTPVLFVQGGSKNVTFWGVGGRTARTEKCRHYYIAKIGFGGSNFDNFYRFSTPATSARYR
jgi:hypothetical protein